MLFSQLLNYQPNHLLYYDYLPKTNYLIQHIEPKQQI